ncbi:MAG TPA: hypothetical protein VHC41_01365 [Mycobacteriales bacterium]|nr:hypothetical protein [Mycobacteriales bacterium]
MSRIRDAVALAGLGRCQSDTAPPSPRLTSGGRCRRGATVRVVSPSGVEGLLCRQHADSLLRGDHRWRVVE